jgi:hypothetical protein
LVIGLGKFVIDAHSRDTWAKSAFTCSSEISTHRSFPILKGVDLTIALGICVAIFALYRIARIIHAFRQDSTKAAKRACWTVVPLAISSLVVGMTYFFPMTPTSIGPPEAQATVPKFGSCRASRLGLAVIHTDLNDVILRKGALGSAGALLGPSVGTTTGNVKILIYNGAEDARTVRILFAAQNGITKTAAFGTDDRVGLFDVGDPTGVMLNDSAQCVIDRMGEPAFKTAEGVEYRRDGGTYRFFGFTNDGRVQWIGNSRGAPILLDIAKFNVERPFIYVGLSICMLCLAVMTVGRPITMLIRARLRASARRDIIKRYPVSARGGR